MARRLNLVIGCLVAAQAASVRDTQRGLTQAERAVLVAVEFTGERRKLTAAARLARTAAAVSAGTALDPNGEHLSAEPKQSDGAHRGAGL